MDSNPAQLGLKYFLPNLTLNIFSLAILPDSASNMASFEEKKGGSVINWNFFSYVLQLNRC